MTHHTYYYAVLLPIWIGVALMWCYFILKFIWPKLKRKYMPKQDMRAKIAALRTKLVVLEETARIRKQHGQDDDDAFKYSFEAGMLKYELSALEDDFYGGVVASHEARLRHLEHDVENSGPQEVKQNA